jgi:hypothetical protein
MDNASPTETDFGVEVPDNQGIQPELGLFLLTIPPYYDVYHLCLRCESLDLEDISESFDPSDEIGIIIARNAALLTADWTQGGSSHHLEVACSTGLLENLWLAYGPDVYPAGTDFQLGTLEILASIRADCSYTPRYWTP